jgi:hypothetical protein
MDSLQKKTFGLLVALGLVMIFTFQNCGPAKLSGDGGTGSGVNSISTVGSKVDLNQLMSAPSEASSNIAYPAPGTIKDSAYVTGNPVIESVALRSNDFSRIEWIQVSTSTVISNGEILSPRAFAPEMLGTVLIYGYRGNTPYFLGQIRWIERGSTTLNANSVGAVTVTQRTLTADSTSESFVLDVAAPNVNVASIEFNVPALGKSFTNQRALVFSKLRTQAVDVNVTVRDQAGQVFARTYTYAGTATPQPTPAATPTPTPAPPAIVRLQTRVGAGWFLDSADSLSGSLAHLWSMAANANQAFQLFSTGELKAHGKCLTPVNAANASRLMITECTGAANQRWGYASATGELKNIGTTQCMDLTGSMLANGTEIIVYTCHGEINQKWDILPY